MAVIRCATCGEEFSGVGDLCDECALVAAMAPEVEDLDPQDAFCGMCGSESLGERPVIRPPRREGDAPWVRCTDCTRAWAAEKREQERCEKAAQAAKLPFSDWRWLRSKFASTCLYCGEQVEEGERVRYAPKLGVAHGRCSYSPQLRLVDDGGRAA